MSQYNPYTMLTQSEIVSGLRALGLPTGAGVMVHSSLKSFGQVQGGPRTVIEALMEVLTPQGTLLMPTFNHGTPFEEGGPGYYHPAETPTINGAMPAVRRSLDPTHPFAAWGRHARRYTQFHHRTLTMGPQSPLGLLLADDGFGLLMGVGYGSNTFHHVVEMSTGAPCLGLRTEAYPVVLPDGREVLGRTWGWRERACPLTDHTAYAAEMAARGLDREVLIGTSRVKLFRLRDCFEVVAAFLREGKQDAPPCSRCPIRPRRVAQTVASDWDAERQRPVPESVAWKY
jgi:aminoglycoside 3-N-acetyltransferase